MYYKLTLYPFTSSELSMVPDQRIKLETITLALLSPDTLFYKYTVDSDQLALLDAS